MAVPSREGEVLDGKYKILRKLGEGGMGAVYAGENARVKRMVAIKILHAGASQSAEMADRFEREAQAAGQIGNDHIVEVYDQGITEAGERYMVMEYLDGEPLRTRIKRLGRLPPRDIALFVAQMLEGLDAAHRAGIIHRDLKPDNVFLCREKAGQKDFVKLLDFGISKFSQAAGGEGGSMTRTGTVMGSPNYMSPEHVRASNEVDAQSDLYSVGVMLFEGLTGTVPRRAPTFAELLFKIVYEPMPDPRTRVPELPPGIVDIVMKACAPQKEHRYGSALELRQALLSFVSGELNGAPTGGGFGHPSQQGDEGQATIALSPGMATAALSAGGLAPNLTPTSHPSFSGSHPGGGFSASQPSLGGASRPSFGGPVTGATSQPSWSSASGAPSHPGFSQPGFHAQAGSTSQPHITGASQPQFGSGSQPQFGSGSQPQFGSGSQPQFGSGSQPQFGSASSSGTPFSVTQTAGAAQPKRSPLPIVIGVGVAAMLGIGVAVFASGALAGKTSGGAPTGTAAPVAATATPTATAAPTAAVDATATAAVTSEPTATATAVASATATAKPTATARPVVKGGGGKKPVAGY